MCVCVCVSEAHCPSRSEGMPLQKIAAIILTLSLAAVRTMYTYSAFIKTETQFWVWGNTFLEEISQILVMGVSFSYKNP